MATIAQINANIGNSKFSTGPRTPEGKQASSRNSLRHGLYASFDALPAEDKQQVDEILAHFSEQFAQPEAEQILHELALAWFRRDRVRAMQAAFLDLQLATRPPAVSRHPSLPRPTAGQHSRAATPPASATSTASIAGTAPTPATSTAPSRPCNRSPNPNHPSPPAETAKTNPIPAPSPVKPTLNGPCPCGSGRKFKRCCGAHTRNSAQASHSSQTVLS